MRPVPGQHTPTRLTLFAGLGALIERGEDHRSVWDLLGVDAPTGVIVVVATDLYPDVIPCLRAVAAGGLRIGLAGNQPARAEPALAALGLPISFTASSARWGVEKPHPEFFERVIAEVDVPARQLAYVGDRLDNDVLPARRAGMVAVFIRRGPWGYLHAHRPDVSQADASIDTLAELPALLGIRAAEDVAGHRIGRLTPATSDSFGFRFDQPQPGEHQWSLRDRSGDIAAASAPGSDRTYATLYAPRSWPLIQ